MRSGFLAGGVVAGLLFAVAAEQQVAVAQSREPTIDERFRDANSNPAEAELPQLNAPQSKLAPAKAPAKKSSAAYLGVTFAGDERLALVRSVAPGSPADQAGLQPNDLIETLQGRRIRTSQDVLDIVAKMRPGEVLDIGFTRRMSIRTQAPLAIMPTAAPHTVGYPPDLPERNMAAPEDPLDTRRAMQNRNEYSNQRRNDNRRNNPSDDNRRLFGRGLRLR
jgi:predicted metalloprotease with PDZ domain